MLRKFIYGNNAPPAEPVKVPEKRPAEPQIEEFALLVTRLDEYQDRVKNAANALSRHCHALTVLSSSCRNLERCFLTPCDPSKPSQANRDAEADHAASVIAEFHESVIKPMQAILATVPQLKLRCDHRESAWSVVQRYQRKIDEIKATNRHEAYRLQRNCAKREAASLRFNELDRDIRAAIHALLSSDVSELLGDKFDKLMELQALEAKATETNALLLQKRVQSHATQETERKSQQQQRSVCHDTMKLNVTGVKASTKSDRTDPERDAAIAAPLRILPQHVLSEEHSMRPRKKHVNGTRTWGLHKQIKDSMASGLDIAECIQLPDNCDLEEWIAVHVVDFFNEISLLFGTISEFCTTECCPQMTAGPCYTYLWADGAQQLTPIALPAAEYVARLMVWVDDQLALFPSEGCTMKKHGSPHNTEFMANARAILKRLFRVYAHMYHHHLDTFEELLAERHLNFCFKRFICFVQLFDLVEQKELNALRKLIQSLMVGSAGSVSTTY